MKKIKEKEISKKIIIMIVIVMLFNFVMPNVSHADAVGIFFKPISQFIAHIADLTIQMLQTYFVGSGDMYINGEYLIRYSPGIIFSGILPSFDINFINPMDDYEVRGIKTYNVGSPENITLYREDLGYEDDENVDYEYALKDFFDEKKGIIRDKKGRNILQVNTEGICTYDEFIGGSYLVKVLDILKTLENKYSDDERKFKIKREDGYYSSVEEYFQEMRIS